MIGMESPIAQHCNNTAADVGELQKSVRKPSNQLSNGGYKDGSAAAAAANSLELYIPGYSGSCSTNDRKW